MRIFLGFGLFCRSLLGFISDFYVIQKGEETEEASNSLETALNLKRESKAAVAGAAVAAVAAVLCSLFSPRRQFTPCIQKASGANVA